MQEPSSGSTSTSSYSCKMDDTENGERHKKTVAINVNGTLFECWQSTLETFPNSRLARRLRDGKIHTSGGKLSFFYDRSATMFTHILDAYRTGKVHFPRDTCPNRFREEMEFWELSLEDVSLCCWAGICKADDSSQNMMTMRQQVLATTKMCDIQSRQVGLRSKIWTMIDNPRSSRLAHAWVILMTLVITASTLISALESLPSLGRNVTADERAAIALLREVTGTENQSERAFLLPHPVMYYLDTVCFCFITMEILLLIFTCPERNKIFKSWLHWMEFIACISFWTSVFLSFNIDKITTNYLAWILIIFKYLSILKLARLFRVTRHLTAFRVIYLTLSASKNEFTIFCILLSILTCLFGFIMYAAEFFNDTKFDTIFRAWYWAIITLTTVGYGDMVPASFQGQLIASFCALCGILVLAMPAGIIVSNFGSYYSYHLYVKRYIEVHKNNICQ